MEAEIETLRQENVRLRTALEAILDQETSGYQGACVIAREALKE